MKAKIIRISLQLFDSKNEHRTEKLCHNFVNGLDMYCLTENNLIEVYRFLKRVRYDIQTKKGRYPLLACQCDYLIYVIDTEIDIVRLKIDNPSLGIRIPKLLKWTDTYTALVELIYGIQDLSVNFGKGKLEEIAACFEFIFQVKLGNISEKFGDIGTRRPKKLYIDRVRENLIKKLNI